MWGVPTFAILKTVRTVGTRKTDGPIPSQIPFALGAAQDPHEICCTPKGVYHFLLYTTHIGRDLHAGQKLSACLYIQTQTHTYILSATYLPEVITSAEADCGGAEAVSSIAQSLNIS